MRFGKPQTGSYLLPVDEAGRSFLYDLKPRQVVELEVLHERDMVEHRKIFAQIRELATALRRDPERLRAELLFKTGNFQYLGELDGKALISVNSMSRHHMKDHELHAFWDDARTYILTELLPEITDDAERDRLASMLFLGEGPPARSQESAGPAVQTGGGAQ